MKLTKEQLKRMIKEELGKVIQEESGPTLTNKMLQWVKAQAEGTYAGKEGPNLIQNAPWTKMAGVKNAFMKAFNLDPEEPTYQGFENPSIYRRLMNAALEQLEAENKPFETRVIEKRAEIIKNSPVGQGSWGRDLEDAVEDVLWHDSRDQAEEKYQKTLNDNFSKYWTRSALHRLYQEITDLDYDGGDRWSDKY